MARKWQKVAALGRRISSPRADECSDFDACSTSSVPEKGHFFVYSSEGKRFMVPLAYLDNDIFKELLKKSAEEFGLASNGPITLPCDAVSMEYVLSLLRRGVSKEIAEENSSTNQEKNGTEVADSILLWGGEGSHQRKSMLLQIQKLALLTTTSVAHKGHFIAYTSDGKRFMVPLEYLETRIFQELLRDVRRRVWFAG
ncbi:hypothetical protein J5N97_001500 [Dioscorea zingiberensis]|uniref:Uncharacterized protein n=1 Tax=Dioscorea zingiberensis TaxID=325984 RepID=A0A9D5BTR2_9LILI|nr:hypothetical protein J5N97_001500 [Dioscorea zingiberensis]